MLTVTLHVSDMDRLSNERTTVTAPARRDRTERNEAKGILDRCMNKGCWCKS